jgi:putative oxidoreductase
VNERSFIFDAVLIARMRSVLAEPAFALLRIVSGALLALHGAQKFGFLSEHTPAVGSQIWIGGLIEVVTGLCIALGFWSSLAAFLASGTMAVAYTQFHWKLRFGRAFLPMQNGGELALVYCLVFLYLAFRGPGPFSLGRTARF